MVASSVIRSRSRMVWVTPFFIGCRPVITLPPYASEAVLVFDHYAATEDGWDGGNLNSSVNGGPGNRILHQMAAREI